jgi:hypothetical protein
MNAVLVCAFFRSRRPLLDEIEDTSTSLSDINCHVSHYAT